MTAPVASTTALEPPQWRPGDRWTYDWTSGTDTGTKTVEIRDARVVNGVPYYVVKIAEVDHYYTRDLHWAAAIREGRVEARMVPPQPWLMWPLEIGRRWSHRGRFEHGTGNKVHDDTFAVLGVETIEVPGGRYQGFRVSRQSGGADSDDYWYVPEVRWYVRWIGKRADVQFEERLREHFPAAGPSSSTPGVTPR